VVAERSSAEQKIAADRREQDRADPAADMT
jgi:hypothetical protein